MPIRFQYEAEFGPLGIIPPLAPKLGFQSFFPDWITDGRLITAACQSTQGTGTYVDFPVPPAIGIGGHPRIDSRVRFQYTEEVCPVLIPDPAPKLGWAPKYLPLNPYVLTLPTAVMAASGQEGHPEFATVTARVAALSWSPEYPDFAPGPRPLPIHPSTVLGFPPERLPLDAKFLAWKPDFPDFAYGRQPLADLSETLNTSFTVASALIDPASFYYTVTVFVNGQNQTPFIVASSVRIKDILNEQPNTCNFRSLGLAFVGGEDIRITVATVTGTITIFGGTVVTVDQIAIAENKVNVAYDVTCQDYSYLLNRRYPLGRYTAQSATAIGQDLITRFSTGFSIADVALGLPEVSVDFDGTQNFMACWTQLANLMGGYGKPTYQRTVALFVTRALPTPDVINATTALLSFGPQNLSYGLDTSQLRNRAIVTGASTSVDIGGETDDVLVAPSTTIPLRSQDAFSSGYAIIGPQQISYTGISADVGHKSLSAGIPQQPSAIGRLTVLTFPEVGPSGSPVGPWGNLQAGTITYKVSYVNINGEESELSGVLLSVAITPVPIPNTPSISMVSGKSGALAAGQYYYQVTFKTGNGETAPQFNFASGTITNVQSPSSSPFGAAQLVAGNMGLGTYQYGVTFKTSAATTPGPGGGETNLSPLTGFGSVTISQITPPSSSVTIGFINVPNGNNNGNIGNIFDYFISCIDVTGETEVAQVGTFTVNAITNLVTLTISAASDPRITSRKLYKRNRSNLGDPISLISNISAGATTYNDDSFSFYTGSTTPGGSPGRGTGKINLTQIQLSNDPRVVGRSIYRTKANAPGVFYKIADINDNTTTTLVDNVHDNMLTELAPSSNSANNGQLVITSLPISSDPRVIGRVIYRTKVNNLLRFYSIATVPDNQTSTFVDNISETNLGLSDNIPPTTSTADNGAVKLEFIPIGPITPVPDSNGVLTPITKARKIYRCLPNDITGLVYYVATLPDNIATSFIDNVPDTSLGQAGLTASEWRTRKGATELPIEGFVSNIFSEAPGWVKVGNQAVRYSTRTASEILGIPASGAGSLTNDVLFETTVVGMPFLKGVTGLLYPLKAGDSISLRVIVDDLAAQAAAALREGPDGVHEFPIYDTTLTTVAQATLRGQAELFLFKLQLKNVTYNTRDLKSVSGVDVTVNLGSPQNISVVLKIQTVTISQLGSLINTPPLLEVEASATKYTLQDVLRQLATKVL